MGSIDRKKSLANILFMGDGNVYNKVTGNYHALNKREVYSFLS